MATLPGGPFGPLKGKFGKLVAANWKGINYLREKPQKSNLPSTPAQIEAREKFKFVHHIIKPLNPYYRAGFKHLAIRKTENNVAFSLAYHKAISGVYPDFEVDYSQLTMSAGILDPLREVVLMQTTPQTLELSWEMEYFKKNCDFDDQLMVAILCSEVDLVDGFIGGTMRADQKRTIKFSSKFVGKKIAVYVGLYSSNQQKISNSQFLGTMIAV